MWTSPPIKELTCYPFNSRSYVSSYILLITGTYTSTSSPTVTLVESKVSLYQFFLLSSFMSDFQSHTVLVKIYKMYVIE